MSPLEYIVASKAMLEKKSLSAVNGEEEWVEIELTADSDAWDTVIARAMADVIVVLPWPDAGADKKMAGQRTGGGGAACWGDTFFIVQPVKKNPNWVDSLVLRLDDQVIFSDGKKIPPKKSKTPWQYDYHRANSFYYYYFTFLWPI